jgi:hypothetical protein
LDSCSEKKEREGNDYQNDTQHASTPGLPATAHQASQGLSPRISRRFSQDLDQKADDNQADEDQNQSGHWIRFFPISYLDWQPSIKLPKMLRIMNPPKTYL